MNSRFALFRSVVSSAVLGILLLGGSGSEALAGYKFTQIDAPGSNDTEVYGVTNDGLVTGFTYDANGTTHGFVWKNGVLKIVDYPGQGTIGMVLYQGNTNGQVCGGYYDVNNASHAFVYDTHTKKFHLLPDVAGSPFNLAGGLTSDCVVAGNSSTDITGSTDDVAWIFANHMYHFSVDPASDQILYGTITQSLNDAYSLVGYYLDANSVAHGFLKPLHGNYITIDIKGADNTAAYGINNFGAITGRYVTNGTRHGFILANGKVTTVDYPGAVQTWVTAINDKGDIGGFFEDAAGDYHAYVGKYVK